jgi:ketosteroid isomerase-like protein
MRFPSLCLGLFLSVWTQSQTPPSTADVKLETCDRLYLVPVLVEGKEYKFLLDTGATSILNIGSFAPIPAVAGRDLDVTSWSGRKAVAGRVLAIKSLGFGGRELRDLRLSAIDLSPMKSACGKTIDGLLGADLLERLGALIDMSARVARLRPRPSELFAEVKRDFLQALDFFNRGDAAQFVKDMDKDVVWFTPFHELRGRDEVARYFHENFMIKHAKVTVLRLEPADLHVSGDSYWLNYEYQMETAERTYRTRGTIFARRKDGKWLATTVHNSIADKQN